MCLYGELATLRLRRHHSDPSGTFESIGQVVTMLCGPEMAICHKISGKDWVMIGATPRTGEAPSISPDHDLISTDAQRALALSANSHIREK
jgi:hypothetical protein